MALILLVIENWLAGAFSQRSSLLIEVKFGRCQQMLMALPILALILSGSWLCVVFWCAAIVLWLVNQISRLQGLGRRGAHVNLGLG